MESAKLAPYLRSIPFAAAQILLGPNYRSLPPPVWVNQHFRILSPKSDCLWSFLSQQDQNDLIDILKSPNQSTLSLTDVPYTVVLTELEDKSWILLLIPGVFSPSTPFIESSEEREASTKPYLSTYKPRKDCLSLQDIQQHSGDECIVDAQSELISQLNNTHVGSLISKFDWESTSIGPIRRWPSSMCDFVGWMLRNPLEVCLFLGSEARLIYNDSFAETFMNDNENSIWASSIPWWNRMTPNTSELEQSIMEKCLAGENFQDENFRLVQTRQDSRGESCVIEVFKTFCAMPYYLEGKIQGHFTMGVDTTRHFVEYRRSVAIVDFWDATSGAKSVQEFCTKTAQFFVQHTDDMPFTVLYTAKSNSSAEGDVTHVHLTRQSLFGIQNEKFIPEEVSFVVPNAIDTCSPPSNSGCSIKNPRHLIPNGWPFADAWENKAPLIIDSSHFVDQFLIPGKRIPTRAALLSFTSESNSGMMIIGLNPGLPYDEDYVNFLRKFGHHIDLGLKLAYSAETEARKKQELLMMDQAKTSFFANASHELRTPLTLILGPLKDILESANMDLTVRNSLKVVWKHANRLLSIVNNLLDLSILESARMSLNFRAVDIGTLTKSITVLFDEAITQAKINFIVDSPPDKPGENPVYLVPELYEKIIYNLLGNAFKYCPSGSISVKVESFPTEVVITVADSGIGIRSQDLPHIFERFYRSTTNSGMAAGSGIGLPLVLEVVKVLGGELSVNSTEGVGSTFEVKLKRGHQHLPPEQITFGKSEDAGPSVYQGSSAILEDAALSREESFQYRPVFSKSETPTGKLTPETIRLCKETIVIVDDSADLREYMKDLLGTKYENVVVFSDGKEALEYCMEHPPSLILSDMMMPGLNGYELLDAFRYSSITRLVPFVLVSARSGIDARSEALERGADAYISKPFSSRELLALVFLLVDTGIARRELERQVLARTKELRESEQRCLALVERYTALNDLNPTAIFLLDRDGNVEYANAAFSEICGMPQTSVLSEAWADYVIDEDREKVYEAIEFTRNSPSGLFECYLRYKTGKTGKVCARFLDNLTFGSRGVGCIIDLTARVHLENLQREAAEQKIRDSEENRRQQERFIDVASHELRNPLSGVWQNAECLKESIQSYHEFFESKCSDDTLRSKMLQQVEEDIQAVDSILLCASHQARIANDILNVSKLSIGLLEIRPTPFHLVAKIYEVLKMFDADCKHKNITLEPQIRAGFEQGDEVLIQADPDRFAQILINLLGNAVKYTTDAPTKKIVVLVDVFENLPPEAPGVTRVGGNDEPPKANVLWICVGVQDSGNGISNEGIQKIFKRFSQANPKTESAGGIGLGLYISKKLVQLHGGFMEVSSSETGTTFRMVLPSARVDSSALDSNVRQPISLPSICDSLKVPSTITNTDSSGRGCKRQSDEDLPRFHILVVEDNPINQQVLARQLRMRHICVTTANNGREGLEKLLQLEKFPKDCSFFDAVLMDIEMPIMTGLEAVRELRKLEESGRISKHYYVAALTGNARQGQIDECQQAGFDKVFLKPYQISDILEHLNNI